MLHPVYCAYGREAAEFFYGGERFGRVGAMPPGVLHLLQDVGSVQQLERLAHRHRKAMFHHLLGPVGVAALSDRVAGGMEPPATALTAGRKHQPV